MQWSKRHVCSEQQILESVPDGAGVYLLVCKRGSMHRVFYAGQTENLKQGLLGQLNGDSNTCVKKHLSEDECFFRFAEVNNLNDRKDLAHKMIVDYRPECNAADLKIS